MWGREWDGSGERPRDGGAARVHVNSRPSSCPLSAHGGKGRGGGYPTVNTETSISIMSISNAIDYLTKSNKGGLIQGKGGRGLRIKVCDTFAPTPASFLPRSHHRRRPPHLCNFPKVAQLERGTYVAGVAHRSLDVRCRRENSTFVARGFRETAMTSWSP